VQAAVSWVKDFVRWYNEVHRHSAIRYVTPAERHKGEDEPLLAFRKNVYEKAKCRNPERWSGNSRNWEPIKEVCLNPENSGSKKRKEGRSPKKVAC